MIRLRGLAITMSALLAMGACGSDRDGEPEATGQGSGPSSETEAVELADAQELIVGTPADAFSLEGDRANLGMFPINANIFENLVRMTPDFQIEPWLAERWEQRDDRTWRFFLRAGVIFHDGQPFTAEAVRFSFERLARGGSGARLGIDEGSVTIVDDLTVDITTTEPNFRLPDQLVHPSIGPIIAPGSDVASAPVGTGAFRFVDYAPEERLVVEANDEYWGERATLDTITFRFIPDGVVRWFSLKSGEVDLIYDLPRQLLPEAEETAGVQLGIAPPGSTEVMFLNRSGPEPYDLLADDAVREALGYAIDRAAVVDQIWEGSAEVSDTMTPAALLGTHASKIDSPSFDPDQARSLLDDAGWRSGPDGTREKDGRRLSLTMVNGYPPIDLREPMPELVQAQLRDIGVEVQIVETAELGSYTERLENGQGDIFLERVSQNDANPAFFGAGFFSSASTGPYARWFAAGDAFDELIAASLAAPDRDDATQRAAEAMDLAIDEEAVVVPVAATYWLFVMKDDVDGFVLHGSARHVRWDTVARTR